TELPSSSTTTASTRSRTHTPPTQPATSIHATSNGGSLNTAPPDAPSTAEVKPVTSVDPVTATGATAATESISAPTTQTDTPPTQPDTANHTTSTGESHDTDPPNTPSAPEDKPSTD